VDMNLGVVMLSPGLSERCLVVILFQHIRDVLHDVIILQRRINPVEDRVQNSPQLYFYRLIHIEPEKYLRFIYEESDYLQISKANIKLLLN